MNQLTNEVTDNDNDRSFPLAHHFVTKEQQIDTANLGMWAFLATEILFFSPLFCSYIVFFYLYPHEFTKAGATLDFMAGTINTVVLLTSSLFVVLAVNSIRENNQKRSALYLFLTIILGLVFLGIKASEYHHHYHHFMPGIPGQEKERLFYCLYFFTTGLHAFHMIIGISVMFVLLCQLLRKRKVFHDQYYTPIELSGLYWHFVDIIWVFIFPLLYFSGAGG